MMHKFPLNQAFKLTLPITSRCLIHDFPHHYLQTQTRGAIMPRWQAVVSYAKEKGHS